MTGYIAEMRKLVGHRTLMQCAASVACIDEQGRILLGKRADNHLWGYSGGAAEIDERAAFNEDDLSLDLREVHRRESESIEKKRKKQWNKGNKGKIQLRENDPKAG